MRTAASAQKPKVVRCDIANIIVLRHPTGSPPLHANLRARHGADERGGRGEALPRIKEICKRRSRKDKRLS